MDLIAALRAFLAVAEEEHVTRGAQRLGVAQPAVSRQVRALEGELGVVLFARTGRRVAITEAGRRVVPLAEDLLERVDRILEVSGRLRSAGEAEVRLAVPPTGDVTLLADAIRLADDHGIALGLVEADDQERRARLADGRVELALVRVPREDAAFGVLLGYGAAPDAESATPGTGTGERPVHLNALRGRAGRRPGRQLLLQPEDARSTFSDELSRAAGRAGLTADQVASVGADTPAVARVLAGDDLLVCSRVEANRSGLRWRPSGDGFARWYAYDGGGTRLPGPVLSLLRRAFGGRVLSPAADDPQPAPEVPSGMFG